MADDSEQPTQVISGSPTPPGGGTATLEPHEPRLDEGGPGGTVPPIPPTGYGGNGGGDDWGGDDGDGGDKRVAILAAVVGVLVVIVLFLALKPGGDDEPDSAATDTVAAEVTPAPEPTATATPADDTPTPTTSQTPAPTATAEGDDGSPSASDGPSGGQSGGAGFGGSDEGPVLDGNSVTKFKATQGDTVTFSVENDADTTQEVHVHGYDKAFDVPAGQTKSYSLKASIAGIFEIEFEESGTQIGELTVEP
ncbi:MAG: hypothetical protein PGN13_04515 [Patulibacter minatonensis]